MRRGRVGPSCSPRSSSAPAPPDTGYGAKASIGAAPAAWWMDFRFTAAAVKTMSAPAADGGQAGTAEWLAVAKSAARRGYSRMCIIALWASRRRAHVWLFAAVSLHLTASAPLIAECAKEHRSPAPWAQIERGSGLRVNDDNFRSTG
eukprot:CAMPEP_0115868498 /NCGR_PEP_ID=MMETSP0287-20121206/21326_1 /TAXON_ID=412157 /ORGANISM="Chrysochromulina rotalis, Strain UIO044" /LENGTH=146 /DNA_ID=CAMNT_0003323159 /DNA_START=890 /DNA_END=1327 /DNA_ORIENTATION=-